MKEIAVTMEPKNKNIIFLDIDGVITTPRTLNSFYNMDIYAINFILWVCKKVDASIVISSTWRYSYKRSFWHELFGDHLHEDWSTPIKTFENNRGKEIKEWLNNHKEVKKYLILDDDNDMLEEQFPNFIQTDSAEGMLFNHMYRIKEFWNIREFPRITSLFIHKNMLDN